MLRLVLLAANHFGPGLSGATLQGCLADLWTIYRLAISIFNVSGVDLVSALGDSQFRKLASIAAIKAALAKCVPGDVLWVHLSSHGTTLSIGGVTHHAVCCYDSDFSNPAGTFLIDDDFTALFFGVKGVRIFVTSDSCFSGNLIKAFVAMPDGSQRVARFIEPPEAMQIEIEHNAAQGKLERAVAPQLDNTCFLSGCGPNQTSDDVRTSTGAYGAFSHTFAEVAKRGMTAEQICEKVNAALAANQFTQRPQLGHIRDWVWAEGAK